jgi:hypothetical protein
MVTLRTEASPADVILSGAPDLFTDGRDGMYWRSQGLVRGFSTLRELSWTYRNPLLITLASAVFLGDVLNLVNSRFAACVYFGVSFAVVRNWRVNRAFRRREAELSRAR